MSKEENRKNVTIHINSKLYDQYSEYCKKEGIILSRQIEKFIINELKKVNKK
jgi:hypothetical protein